MNLETLNKKSVTKPERRGTVLRQLKAYAAYQTGRTEGQVEFTFQDLARDTDQHYNTVRKHVQSWIDCGVLVSMGPKFGRHAVQTVVILETTVRKRGVSTAFSAVA